MWQMFGFEVANVRILVANGIKVGVGNDRLVKNTPSLKDIKYAVLYVFPELITIFPPKYLLIWYFEVPSQGGIPAVMYFAGTMR